MKNILVPVAAIFLAIICFTSCGNKTEEVTAPAGMQVLDLTKYGKPFTLFVPDSSKGVLTVTEKNYMLEIASGKSFGLVIEEGDGNMEQKRADIKDGDGGVSKFKNYITDEPNMIVWESEITKPEFHLYAIVTVGTAKYIVQDLNSTENEPYTSNDIKAIMEAVKSIKEKVKA
ncbi:MAG: hypothetical protein IAF38_08715 [Bacteroidia bacterium]|nr:hypothetical protein [Bacteroidia bacterium]